MAPSALPVSQLALLLESLPRPVRLSFVEGSGQTSAALEGSKRRIDSMAMEYPEHFLRQVVVPYGRGIGLRLMTVMNRPIIQEVVSRSLREQGVRPCDVLVSIGSAGSANYTHLSECTADEAVQLLKKAKAESMNAPLVLGILRLSGSDAQSSYNMQHPIDVAAALTDYDAGTMEGTLSFSVPYTLPLDKYKIEVFRYGSQLAPDVGRRNGAGGAASLSLSGAGGASDISADDSHCIRITHSGGAHVKLHQSVPV